MEAARLKSESEWLKVERISTKTDHLSIPLTYYMSQVPRKKVDDNCQRISSRILLHHGLILGDVCECMLVRTA